MLTWQNLGQTECAGSRGEEGEPIHRYCHSPDMIRFDDEDQMSVRKIPISVAFLSRSGFALPFEILKAMLRQKTYLRFSEESVYMYV